MVTSNDKKSGSKDILAIIKEAANKGNTRLDLSRHRVSELPDEIGQLTNLAELNLSQNLLQTLPESIGQLTSLSKLDLFYNQLKLLPERIGQLDSLMELNLGGNQLHPLPEIICQLTNLTRLNIAGNQLTSLPDSFGQLTKLKWLHLVHNRLQTLPDSFGQLSSLTEIDLAQQQLTSLPESIGQLTNLAELDLSHNQLQTLPESIGQLVSLAKLDLCGNQLMSLPESIGQLTNLAELDLAGNQLLTLPESIDKLVSLATLNLYGNRLEELPRTFGQLTCLTNLRLSHNQLRTLPGSIGHLTQLTELDLQGNQLTSLPHQFGKLSSLRCLNLDDNELYELPPLIGELSKLSLLRASNNQISEISRKIGLMSCLEYLHVQGNKLLALPKEILDLGMLKEAILFDDQHPSLHLANLTNQWDVFVSYASEDSLSVAKPLYEILLRAGIRVWLDKHQMRIGDSIRKRIDDGLSRSRFGVVILSPSYIKKTWTERELASLLAIEENGERVVLPVWHEIDRDTVLRFSPIIADRFAANTSDGIARVASQIIDVVLYQACNSPATVSPTLTRRFLELIERDSARQDLIQFLLQHPRILGRALGSLQDIIVKNLHGIDWADILAVFDLMATKGPTYCYLVFGRGSIHGLDESSDRLDNLESYVSRLRTGLSDIRDTKDSSVFMRGHSCAVVLAGRRYQMSDKGKARLTDLNSELVSEKIKIRTYDWIIDAAVALEKSGT